MTRVPFSFDLNDGLITVRGTVSLVGDELVIAARWAALDLVPYRTDTYRLATDEVASIEIERGMVSQRLVIEPFSFEAIEDFPSQDASSDALVLPIKRKHVVAADALARATRLRNLPR